MIFREGARLREVLISAGRDAGFEPRVTLESNDNEKIRRLVSRDLGVAILPRSEAGAPESAVAVASLSEPALTRDIKLAWRNDRRHSPAAEEFLRVARTTFA